MSAWPSANARRVLAALLRIGWTIKRESGGSNRVLARPGWLARIARRTGLTPEDL